MDNKYTKVAAHALIKKDGKYLVLHRAKSDDYMPDFWDIPGGTIEFGEDILAALEREIEEEASLKIKINNIIFAYNFLSGEIRHQFMLVYACDFISGDIVLDPSAHDEFRWVTLDEMKELKKIKFLDELYKQLIK